MNERIKLLAEQAGLKQRIWNSLGRELPMWQEDPDNPGLEKFAELIVKECTDLALAEIVPDEEIDNSDDIEDRCYLRGNNGGIVDTVIRFRNHFGVEE